MDAKELCALLADELNVRRITFRLGSADGELLEVSYDRETNSVGFVVGGTARPSSVLAEELILECIKHATARR